MQKRWQLIYGNPARNWNEGLPLGNGSLGAMVSGAPDEERIDLNLDTLWSGDGRYKGGENTANLIPEIRKLVLGGNYEQAEELIKDNVLGDWGEGYMPLGSLLIKQKYGQRYENYERKLDLNQALYSCSYSIDGVIYEKEMFCSMTDNIFVLKMTASEPQIELKISLESKLEHTFEDAPRVDQIMFKGNAPIFLEPDHRHRKGSEPFDAGKGISCGTAIQVDIDGGILSKTGHVINIEGAKEVLLILSGSTNFGKEKDFDNLQNCLVQLENGEKRDYHELKEQHITEFSSYFGRVDLILGDRPQELELQNRLKKFQEDREDQDLIALMFHYGRYLMISSSKPGTQAINLQGIWNDQLFPPWNSDYTVNINTEMNYWPSNVCNLSEFQLPLFDLIERTSRQGEKAAQEIYGLNGWVAHHNIDIWGHSTPVGKHGADREACSWGFWPLGSGWLCCHLWEHYAFTQDKKFLEERAYPLMEGAVRFYLEYLTEFDNYLVTVPSTSPENLFKGDDGEVYSVTVASTMDVAIIRELFKNFLLAGEILNCASPLSKAVQDALEKLPPFKVGKHGQLQEWYFDYDEEDQHHRHVSHLYPLHPGSQINPDDQPDLAKACEVSLIRRGDEGTGWSLAWKANLWARLKNGDKALDLMGQQLRLVDTTEVSSLGGGTYLNLFCAHPPFQIDGNFGLTAAIAEMLIQSHTGKIELLPALPLEWSKGEVRGLLARGGYTISFSWDKGKIVKCKIEAMEPRDCQVIINGEEITAKFGQDKTFTYNGEFGNHPPLL